MTTPLKITRLLRRKSKGLSLHWDRYFIERIIVVTGVVFVWRGLWGLMDIYLFPDNFLFSNITSVLLGLVILFLPDSDIKELN